MRWASETVQGDLEEQAHCLGWERTADSEARKPWDVARDVGQPQRGPTVARAPRMVQRRAEGPGWWEAQVWDWAPAQPDGQVPWMVQLTGPALGGFQEAHRGSQTDGIPGVVWGALDSQAPLRRGGL